MVIKICLESDCENQAWYNYPDDDERLYCREHCKEKMVAHFSHSCIEKDCYRFPYYNTPDHKGQAIYCGTHKTKDMVNVLINKCIEDDCIKIPSFNFKGEKKCLYCKEHAKPNMINVHKARCQYFNEDDGEFCCNNPLWNFSNEASPKFCNLHKEIGMVCLTNVICTYANCVKSASHNFPTETSKLYCPLHALPGMIDKKHKYCIHEGCTVLASYNLKGEKTPLYCGDHADKTKMPNVKNRICEIEDCIQRALFGQVGEKTRFCGKHRDGKPTETFVKPNIDTVNKKCDIENCNGHRTYGFNEKNTHCNKHKLEGMIKSPNIKCKSKECKTRAIYGIIGGKPMYCEEHKSKEKDLFNMIEKKCTKCELIEIMSEDEGICIYCTNTNKIEKLRKEIIIKQLLDKNHIKYNTHNINITDNVCDQYRPDFSIDMTTHMVILEIDEFQHKKYLRECENTRMFNITQSLGGFPVIWIRYNPNTYMMKNVKMNTTDEVRHKTLIQYLTKFTKEPPNTLSEVIYLYYNDYTKNREILDMKTI